MVFDFVERTSHVLFVIVGIVMKVAPIGAFGAMAFTIGKYGPGSLLSLVGLGIPTGYSIYLTLAAVFIAQATNTSMTPMQQITLLAVLLLTSKGALGNGVAKVVVAKWTGDLDVDQMRRRLDNETDSDADAPEQVLDPFDQHMPV